MSTLQKRGNVWWVYFRDPDGKLKGKSLKVATKTEALAKQRAFDASAKQAASIDAFNAMTPPEREAWEVAALGQWKVSIDAAHAKVAKVETTNANQQKEMKALWDAEQARKAAMKDRSSLSFEQLWESWQKWAMEGDPQNRADTTIYNYSTVCARFLKLMKPGNASIGTFDKTTFDTFQNRLRKLGLAERTIFQYMISLQGIFSVAIKQGWYHGENPLNMPYKKTTLQRHRFLSQDEIKSLIEHSKEWAKDKDDLQPLIFNALGIYAGLRPSESANLRWVNIDFNHIDTTGKVQPLINIVAKKANPDKAITKASLKNNQARSIPIHSNLLEILLAYRQADGYVVPGEFRRMPCQIFRSFHIVLKNAGIKDCTPHTLRHTFASQLAIAGVSIYKISKWMGHSNVQTTADLYAHLQAYDEEINRL